MVNNKYRADIDGLRAISVLFVILFHLKFDIFSGGFIGVDVFFVISGFLITRLIKDEIESTGKFNFVYFYVRRARRILPALLFTLLGCFIASFLLFLPQDFSRNSISTIYAALGLSNIHFWAESGYFDVGNYYKPLLHTWSLGVEEQFYVFWPLFLYFAYSLKQKHLVVFLVLFVVSVSLYANKIFEDGFYLLSSIGYFFDDGQSTIFYLAPFRAFELAIGACLVWGQHFFNNKLINSNLLSIAGLVAMLFSVLTYSHELLFPSYYALVPCLGAVIVIYSGQSRISSLILQNKLSIYLGKISYSLYLVHWPIIVFWGYNSDHSFSFTDQVAIFIVSVLVATIMFHLVEQPFRRKHDGLHHIPAKRFLSTAFISMALVLSVSFHAWTTNGWDWRFSGNLITLNSKLEPKGKYVHSKHKELRGDFSSVNKTKLLVAGDSLAGDFVNILNNMYGTTNIEVRTIPIGGCKSIFPLTEAQYSDSYFDKKTRRENCRLLHKQVLRNENWKKADKIFVAFLWSQTQLHRWLKQEIDQIKLLSSASVYLVGSKAQKLRSDDLLKVHRHSKEPHLIRGEPSPAPPRVTVQNLSAVGADGVIDMMSLFCTTQGCQRFTKDGYLILYDAVHLTKYGAAFMGERLIDSKFADWIYGDSTTH